MRDRPTDKQTNRTIDQQSNRQTGRPGHREVSLVIKNSYLFCFMYNLELVVVGQRSTADIDCKLTVFNPASMSVLENCIFPHPSTKDPTEPFINTTKVYIVMCIQLVAAILDVTRM